MDNYTARGDVIKLTLVGPAFSGVPFAMHDTVGVPEADGDAGDTIAVRIEGICLLPLKSGATDADVLSGKKVHFDGTSGEIIAGAASVVTGDINNIGIVADDVAKAADAEINIKLTPGTGTEV